MDEEAKKQRPSISITTYTSQRRNSFLSKSNQNNDQQTHAATRADISTDLFISNNSKRFHLGQNRTKMFQELHQIKGPSGSVRGHKDVVRKSLQNIKEVISNSKRNFSSNLLPTFVGSTLMSSTNSSISSGSSSVSSSRNQTIQRIDEQCRLNYLRSLVEDEQDQCVAYITTLGVIRRTFEDSRLMKSILNLNLIKYEERDIYLNQEYKHQLAMRCNSITVPALFVDGRFFGGFKELELLNESGELARSLAKFKMSVIPKTVCSCCGGAKFIACRSCNGSRKSTIRHFKFNSIALRCMKCNYNDGLVPCPYCSQQNTQPPPPPPPPLPLPIPMLTKTTPTEDQANATKSSNYDLNNNLSAACIGDAS